MLALSVATNVGAKRPRALVLATDFETGILTTVATTEPRRVRALRTPVFSDAVVRVTGGLTIVLNRFLADNVQVLGPRLGTRLQCGTGPGSNPHDVVVVAAGTRGGAPGKAYVTRYGGTHLWVVDPAARGCGRFQTGTIDLSAWADADGIPEMDQMILVGSRLYVTLQHLDRTHGFAPAGKSWLLAIDTTTDAVVGDPIVLPGENVFGDASGIAREPGGRRLAVSTTGDIYAVGDGGIGWVDPEADPPAADPGFFLREDDVQGNVTDFVLVSATRGYAIVQGVNLRNAVVAFDPTRATAPERVLVRDGYMPDIALAPDGMLWIADQSRPGYGIRIFDPATNAITKVIDVGLPPFSVGFLP